MTDAASDGSAPSTNVKIIVEPSDNGAAILTAIQGAKSSVHVTMYLLSNTSIVSALAARKKAGLDVKVVLNQGFPDPTMSNQAAYDALAAAGVGVAWAPKTFVYTHEKCVIIDKSVAWIMTMNLTFSSPSQNREYLAVDSEPADVQEAEGIFAADFAGTPAPIAGRLVVAPVNARQKIADVINGAKQSLDVEAETLSDSALASALASKAAGGVAVRVVVSDQAGTTAMTAAIASLKKANAKVVKMVNPTNHAKAVVADGALGYVGSENLTQNSLDSNRELGVIVGGSAATTLTTTIDQDFKAGTPL